MKIGISNAGRNAVAIKLRFLLADEFMLYGKTRSCHWNIEGVHFSELHSLYEQQYKALEATIDEVAERIRMLGFYSPGMISEFLDQTQLKDQDVTNNSDEQLMILLNDHEAIIRSLRSSIEEIMEKHRDFGTADFFTRIMQMHEKMSWIIRSTARKNLAQSANGFEKKKTEELA